MSLAVNHTLATGGTPADAVQRCAGCRQMLPPSSFPLKKKGQGAHEARTKTCEDCTARKKSWRAEKGKDSQADKENEREKVASKGDGTSGKKGRVPREVLPDALTLDAFLQFLANQQRVFELEARVSMPEIRGEAKDRANELATRIWDNLQYRFM
ncbi:hypothetical protein K466DRAFT_68735 [Polyporus arcularius HHB13444]|uniref:Stc1 domain-containing protein n=1 Tax=Polyporus arcularius HHB13444 TaxID=1314778 RepID=A0A5C3NYT2_9APHY|nr:hypothetical protein K466DRAFT_68735 [Polyporus arcularius HHB13444]